MSPHLIEFLNLFHYEYFVTIFFFFGILLFMFQSKKAFKKKENELERVLCILFSLLFSFGFLYLLIGNYKDVKTISEGEKTFVGYLTKREKIPHSPSYRSHGEYFIFKDEKGNELYLENRHLMAPNRFDETLYSDKIYEVIYYDVDMIKSIKEKNQP